MFSRRPDASKIALCHLARQLVAWDFWLIDCQIANPHLIYPGDQLDLVYIDGKPQLRLRRGPLKLSPTVRSTPWDTGADEQ